MTLIESIWKDGPGFAWEIRCDGKRVAEGWTRGSKRDAKQDILTEKIRLQKQNESS